MSQRTKIFFDCEFTGLHQHTTLISIGCVAESGEKFYAELIDYAINQCDEWIEKNVLANLWIESPDLMPDDMDNIAYVVDSRGGTADALHDWLSQFGELEMWGDVLAYDWVLFCELFGGAMSIPDNVYYIPMDVATWLRTLGDDPDTNRERLAGPRGLPDSQADKHNALHDAWVLSRIVKEMERIAREAVTP